MAANQATNMRRCVKWKFRNHNSSKRQSPIMGFCKHCAEY